MDSIETDKPKTAQPIIEEPLDPPVPTQEEVHRRRLVDGFSVGIRYQHLKLPAGIPPRFPRSK